jgi:hypothetical protein
VDHAIKDPYRDCETGRCNHDLVRGVATADLLAADGPYPPSYLIVNLAAGRPTLFDDMEQHVEVRQAS